MCHTKLYAAAVISTVQGDAWDWYQNPWSCTVDVDRLCDQKRKEKNRPILPCVVLGMAEVSLM